MHNGIDKQLNIGSLCDLLREVGVHWSICNVCSDQCFEFRNEFGIEVLQLILATMHQGLKKFLGESKAKRLYVLHHGNDQCVFGLALFILRIVRLDNHEMLSAK